MYSFFMSTWVDNWDNLLPVSFKAFEVSLVQSWVDLPRILAIIKNDKNQQTV